MVMNKQAAALTLALLMTLHTQAGTRDSQWKSVEDALSKGLPRTAITNLEPIISDAIKDKAWAEATKAIARKAALEGIVQGGKPEERIRLLESQIGNVPKEMIPMLDTVLAHWYWDYFRQNRWRFLQRTATEEPPGPDFTTWDLRRLFAHIDSQFSKALAAESSLKSTPVDTWDDLLEKGTVPDSHRPTLYDFVAHEALQFYTSGEQAGAKPQDASEIPADSPIFDSIDVFVAWDPRAKAPKHVQESPLLKAILIFQELLQFHRSDADPSARLDVDLQRLAWGGERGNG